ncbi:MAG: tRNA (guanosine(37)-N1)-methyltransferase TrmD [Firmicutes bacterium]|nr:tRNA (guanosine(37)-N1)-methyltransferase TrmD [Bacillota bacterium]
MKIKTLTLFKDMFGLLKQSIIGRAILSGALDFEAVDIRDYSLDKHKKCDDMPYGGGSGMVMTVQPIVSATRAIDPQNRMRKIYLSPRGRVFNNTIAKELAKEDGLLLLCGHYEGVDQRALDICGYEELSIGDYVLTGGELAAMVVIDAVSRFVDGVLGSDASSEEESFSDTLGGLLEYPHYTRPAEFEGHKVPDVLLSGHHAQIKKWRMEKAKKITEKMRGE